ncbi:PQQ-binding-like beta-propeller repeat protein [Nonomuraea sp. NPDC048826]|uniref:outer membrane protein assembly factor BamB family protein n=1 Tax=Nonomuraea sp. NPDC048826 TaxID=3364347 RepID=UPI00371274FA
MIGKTLWERPLHQHGSLKTVAVTADRVVVHERATRLVCLDRRDGSVRWDVPVGGDLRGIAVAGDRCLVVPYPAARLSCLSLATGAEVWRAPLRSYAGHVVVSGRTVVAGGWRDYSPVAAFDLPDGRPLWSTPRRVETLRPLPWGDALLLGSGREAWLIDPRDGRELTRLRLPEPVTKLDLSPAFTRIDAERCLVRCGPRSVVCLWPASGRAARFYDHDADLGYRAPACAGGVVWLGTGDAGYVAVDPDAGSVRWSANAGRPFAPGVVCDGEGFVLAGQGGVLFRLGPDGRILDRSWSSARRVAGLLDLGAGEMVMATKGTLRLMRTEVGRQPVPS